MGKRSWTVQIENRESLARGDLPVIGVAARAIEAGDALKHVVLRLGQIHSCGLCKGTWKNNVKDQQQDKG